MNLLHSLGKPYLAGSSLEEGIAAIEENYQRGLKEQQRPLCSTLDILGEAAQTAQDTQQYLQAYTAAGNALWNLHVRYLHTSLRHQLFSPFTLSLKPSALVEADTPQEERASVLEERLLHLEQYFFHIPLTIDMEDHSWTTPTLQAAQSLWKKGKEVGIVLQSRLYRTLGQNGTPSDLSLFHQSYPLKHHPRVRACIGIYQERQEIATPNLNQAKQNLLMLVSHLLAAPVHVEIATHDPQVIDTLQTYISRAKIPLSHYEFQFLKGVYGAEEVLVPKLLKQGKTVRLYMPLELQPGAGDAYIQRRIMANPRIAWNWLKDRTGHALRKISS